MTDTQIRQVAIGVGLAAAWVWTAVRVGKLAPQYGRRRWVWTVVSLLATALPAMLVFWVDYFRSLSAREQLPQFRRRLRPREHEAADDDVDRPADASVRRCPHCGAVLAGPPAETCPQCHMTLDQEHHA